jgi:hypothetical protein
MRKFVSLAAVVSLLPPLLLLLVSCFMLVLAAAAGCGIGMGFIPWPIALGFAERPISLKFELGPVPAPSILPSDDQSCLQMEANKQQSLGLQWLVVCNSISGHAGRRCAEAHALLRRCCDAG